MTPYRESQFRKLADPPTLAMINEWHSVSNSVLARPIEIVVDDRRNNPKIPPIPGEINLAYPIAIKQEVVLGVWVESFPSLKLQTVAHEIGHWVLKLRGFRGMLRQPRDIPREGIFNDVASHRPLYALQRSTGYDPQNEVDSRCDHDIKLCSQRGAIDEKLSALYFADDLLNGSYKKRRQLKSALRKKQPNTLRYVDRILHVASEHDPLNPEQNIAFRRMLVKELKLAGTWSEQDDIKRTKELIKKAEGKAP